MKIDKLTALMHEIEKELHSQNITCKLHYKNKSHWTKLDGTATNTQAIPSLERSITEPVAYHAPSSLTAHYHLIQYNATISLTFAKSPRLETRKRYRKTIEKIQESASNAYRVSHHALTYLLAKDAFRETLKEQLTRTENKRTPNVAIQESKHPRILAVMALDIDYFKQVNDTWGHLYGDQVLKAFGKRLEKCASTIQSAQQDVNIYLGHPSGEEFLILISANSSREQFINWANQFRASICDEVLPSDEEWQWLCKSEQLSALTLPPAPERGLSTSIGIAFHSSILKVETSIDQSAGLLDLADTALYRAKAAGRNQVILYDEILSSCGRIIEQNTNTGVIAIDIGSNVGVLVGQEFKVYHPTYTGKTKFSVNDGRTTRTLGIYPRVESGRIIVFNSQPEISFAVIDGAEDTNLRFEPGSHLESIPAGSIGHLLSNVSKYFTSPHDPLRNGDINSLQEFIASSTGESFPFAIVIRFTREAEYLKKYGTAALNKALAKLYRTAQTEFLAPSLIAVLDTGSICIVGPNKNYNEKKLTTIITELNSELPSLEVTAGICNNADIAILKDKHKSTIDRKSIIELARFSASEVIRTPEAHIHHFNTNTVSLILQSLNQTQSFDTAYTDFKRLIKLGVHTGTVYNLGGLIASNLDLGQKALENFHTAHLREPTNTTFKTNYGTAALSLNEIEPGLKVLNTLSSEEVESIFTGHPYGFFAYAALLAKAKLSGSTLFDKQRFDSMGERALTLINVPEHFPNSTNAIRKVLAEIVI